ncbi:polysaccharide biosynthesis tyrosine autokinase [Lactococcus nasutitermitis]|uniref:Tyrosine-protein kinase CpsD n=1 Tax=Lactococcus nasutitermitis TaxID=1652957 RepID=A0ABV9JD12_9LACT|nr:polysaccharide biosynthesis tyrosine autokinase [Lactococcus nasutitermitis]
MANKNKNISDERLLITSINPLSPISEQYRTLRTNIEFIMADKGLKTLSITSANAGAGKSTTTGNLAITFAQQGKKVLLIDGDLRKPVVHQVFKVRNFTGLTNVLARQVDLNSAIQRTRMNENLFVLASGPIPPNPSELLGSLTMRELLKDVTQKFDIVLIDTPPLMSVTDAQLLSQITDGVLVVAHANQTKKEELARAKRLLEQVKANILGCILHGVENNDTSQYYYYGAE